ncbi:TPR end-of-group domain-containing protein [Chloroflexus sp.]|uniref:TPR end-of-group domain-containing protein n=1 Tax=Chloroflexus sp. TaxID=1904827 RepID=UPI00298F10E6|nr:hypothetical protein [Chloroflexus sp.]MDW8403817.1 hypothetical protein [Chloroflexus sp.]
MSEAAFRVFRAQVFALHNQHSYQAALALIDQHAPLFPQYESDLFFWRACLTGCMGDKAGAIGWLQQAAERGLWYHERMLRDPDLDLLRGSAELAQLQALFHQRYAQAQAASIPQRRVWEPAGSAHGLLLALHGASGSIVIEGGYWQPATELGWRVAMLQSAQLWAPGRYHWADTAQALAEVRQHLAELAPAPMTVMAGFSMGAAVAIRAVMSGAVAANRFLAVAPAIRPEQVEPLIAAANPHTRGYVVIGDLDSLYRPVLEWANALQQAGLPCEVEVCRGVSHDYPPDFMATLRRGLAFLTA